MPRYRFEGFAETVLSGLSHGVNAVLHREGHEQPDGSTVVAVHGDEVETDELYPHSLMVNVETGKPDLEVAAAAPAAAPAARKKAPRKAPAKKAAAKAAAAPETTAAPAAALAPSVPVEGQE